MYPVLGGAAVPAAWQQGLANGALEGKALLIGTTRDEATAFFGSDPRIQKLTPEGALDILTNSLGRPLGDGLRIEADCFNQSISASETFEGLRQFNERDHPDRRATTTPVTPGLARSL